MCTSTININRSTNLSFVSRAIPNLKLQTPLSHAIPHIMVLCPWSLPTCFHVPTLIPTHPLTHTNLTEPSTCPILQTDPAPLPPRLPFPLCPYPYPAPTNALYPSNSTIADRGTAISVSRPNRHAISFFVSLELHRAVIRLSCQPFNRRGQGVRVDPTT